MAKSVKGDPRKDQEMKEFIKELDAKCKPGFLKNIPLGMLRKLRKSLAYAHANADDYVSYRHEQSQGGAKGAARSANA